MCVCTCVCIIYAHVRMNIQLYEGERDNGMNFLEMEKFSIDVHIHV